MYPMLREGVELEQYEASEDPYADFPENLDAVHCYAENPDGDLFAIDADIFHALLHADGRGPLPLPPSLLDDADGIVSELVSDGLLQTSRFVKSGDRINRFVLFLIPERTPNIASLCRGIQLTLPIAAPLLLAAGLLLQFFYPATGGAFVQPLYYALFFLSLFLHEIGHLAAGLAYGYPLRDLSILFLGYFPIGACVACQPEEVPHRPKEEIQFSLAGVEVNLLLAGIFLLLSLLVPAARETFREASLANILLFSVNILPASHLDGEAALSTLLGVESASDTARLWLQSGRRRRKLLHEGARGIGFLFLFLFVRLAQVLLFVVIAVDIISPVFSMAALLWRYT